VRWRERLNDWFRRTGSGEPGIADDFGSASVPLSEEELDALKKSYLYRLREQLGTLHLYGLDERRRAAQDGGQTLDPLALYQPLSTTVRVPVVESDGNAEANAFASVAHKTRPLTALEAVGQAQKAILRGRHGTGKSTFVRYLALSLAERTGVERLEPAWTHGWLFPV
jgi:hypothetical protein